jgi:DNA-binding Lrp family transcriptional regulator
MQSPELFLDGYAGRNYETISALMNPILKLLVEGGHLTPAQLAQVAGLSEAEVDRQLDQLKKDRILLGWRPVLDLSRETVSAVRAVIEVRITPERGGGFDRIAERLSRFDEVESCFLMSGGYDLLIFVNGPSLQKLAGFVSEKLATLEGVVSTSTHFILRSYKEGTFLMGVPAGETGRLKVSP